MSQETSKTISEWGEATFGEVKDLEVLVERARAEMDELVLAIRKKNPDDIGEEAADVAILLHRIAGLVDRDLASDIDAKMQVNRARKWKAAGDGTGGHV